MRYKGTLVFLLILVFACKQKPEIAHEKLVDLMVDCMLLESGNQVQYNFGNLPKNIWSRDYAFVCKKHGVDTASFRRTVDYMGQNPEEFSKVLEEVITRLQKEEMSNKDPKQ